MKQLTIGDHVVGWVAQHMRRGEGYGLSQGIGLLDDGCLIAGVVYNEYNKVNINMHVAAIGKRWMTREYLRYCFRLPFATWGVNKVIGLVDSTNTEAMKFDLHLGFEVEARIKDAGRFGDLFVLSMTRQQCRFLKD